MEETADALEGLRQDLVAVLVHFPTLVQVVGRFNGARRFRRQSN